MVRCSAGGGSMSSSTARVMDRAPILEITDEQWHAGLDVQDRVGRATNGVAVALGFQQLVELGLGERRVAAEIENKAPAAIAGDHRHQDGAPLVGAMHVAAPEHAALEIAELVEQEQRMVAGAAEVAVVGRALLLAVGRALR